MSAAVPLTMPDNTQAILANHGTRLQGIEVSVAKMESEVGSLQGKMEQGFQSLAGELAKRAQTPWGTLISAGSLLVVVMGVIGTLAFLPVKTQIETLQDAHGTLRREMRQEMKDFPDRREVDVVTKYHEKTIDRLERQLDRLEAEVMWRRQRYSTERRDRKGE